ncbi:MAG: acyl-CoA thioesterase [Planctomycetes bacterium]|nr:acyl-CoA thioesterase [Planctomycetota bacterium]
MSWVIYFFGSGFAFFAGCGLILAALAAFSSAQHRWQRSVALVAAVTGLILVALSATPLPYGFYAVAGVVTLAWLIVEQLKEERYPRVRNWLRRATAIIWFAGLVVEAPFLVTPTLKVDGNPTLYVIGDSVAAGVGDETETWPRILARKHAIEVNDFSHAGATVSSALKQAERLPPRGGIVLLEIGGNDVLGSTTAARFNENLDQLLARVRAPNRLVVMFELPLPPFQNEYGRIQRRLALKHGVRLVPKRVFAGVLTKDGATLDSVHLSAAGHQTMANAVWGVLGR